MVNQNTQTTKKTQIIRKDGRNCLMEVNTQSFSIDKVQFVFNNYNPSLPKGQRTTDRVVIYMDFPAALEFAQSILDGRLSKQLVEANKKFGETNKPWDKDVVLAMGGTPNPKNRTDGKAESRIMKAQLGTKNPIALIASTGPGSVNEKGLIIPEKGAKTDHSVMMTLSAKDIREVALMIKAHIEAYLNVQYVKGLWSNQMVQQDQYPNQNQNYQSAPAPTAPAPNHNNQGQSGYQKGYQNQNQNNYQNQQQSQQRGYAPQPHQQNYNQNPRQGQQGNYNQNPNPNQMAQQSMQQGQQNPQNNYHQQPAPQQQGMFPQGNNAPGFQDYVVEEVPFPF